MHWQASASDQPLRGGCSAILWGTHSTSRESILAFRRYRSFGPDCFRYRLHPLAPAKRAAGATHASDYAGSACAPKKTATRGNPVCIPGPTPSATPPQILFARLSRARSLSTRANSFTPCRFRGMVAILCYLVCTMSTTSGCSLARPGLKTSVVKDRFCYQATPCACVPLLPCYLHCLASVARRYRQLSMPR